MKESWSFMKLTAFFLLFSSLLFSQEQIYPFVAFMPIEEYIGLLPDKKSYYVNEEYYHNDTLTKSRIAQIFYNYGHSRVWIYTNDEPNNISNKIITLQILNDTFSIQTSRYYNNKETYLDSMLIYSKDGNIYKIIHRHKNKFSTSDFLEYKDGLVVKKTTLYANGSTSITTRTYENGQLMLEKTLDSDGSTEVSEFVYADKLLSCRTKVTTHNTIYFTNTQCNLDTEGKILISDSQDFIENYPVSEKHRINTYTYEIGGKFTHWREHPLTGFKQEMVHIPGNPTIEKYFWPNDKVRMTKTYNQMASN